MGHSESLNGLNVRLVQAESTIYRKPGELYISEKPVIVSTVPGSCMSVNMFCPERLRGAICHALLPRKNTSGESLRYVDTSILSMLLGFARYGISRTQMEVKMVGGSDILFDDAGRCRGVAVCRQNIESALRVVEEERLRLVESVEEKEWLTPYTIANLGHYGHS
jgi:chemotaxis protein CheD